ncbi:hypothetical protein CRG98_014651 [Punica granatum]|uniref:G-patch domain-containing protein n=1 Tax=Punica granatum TaxID=22663 RepID=A0A2I0K8T1_PUNGR|nr:hypothetical protein CRG98_014651 [Punica granatum]
MCAPTRLNSGAHSLATPLGTYLVGSSSIPFACLHVKVTEEEAEAFMKIIKASEYKVVEQMAKSRAHVSLLALLLSSEPHRETLLRVLTAVQVSKETPPGRIEETVSSIFSNTISFSDDELPYEGWAHSLALHIVCKCNNCIIGRVMIDNGFALNVCPVNGEIDLLIEVGPCSFSITFQVLDIPNAFSLLLGRPWIHSAGAVPSSLHQRLKFIVEEKLITVKEEEDYAVYKETAVPYISVGDDENLSFHSFETISVSRDYGEVGPSRADRMIGKVLLRHNYTPGAGLGARGQGINCPIEVEEYKNRRGLGFRPSCHEIIEACRDNLLHRLAAHYGKLNRGIPVPSLSRFFPRPPHIIGSTLDDPSSDSDDAPAALPAVLHSNPYLRHIDSNPFEELSVSPDPYTLGKGLPRMVKCPSTPFWPTGFPHEDSRPKLGILFIIRQSEANRRAQSHEQ